MRRCDGNLRNRMYVLRRHIGQSFEPGATVVSHVSMGGCVWLCVHVRVVSWLVRGRKGCRVVVFCVDRQGQKVVWLCRERLAW